VHPVGEDQGRMIATANVRHSQSVTAPPLKSWVAAERCGTIICSHCTCMAGLGGACSHIAALLFAAEAHNRLKDTSCTSQPCAWLSPNMKNVAYVPISGIDFTASTTKRGSKAIKISQQEFVLPPPPSKERIDGFIHEMLKQGNLHCCLSCRATVMNM